MRTGLISTVNRVSDVGCGVMLVQNEMCLDFQRVSKNMALWPNLLLNAQQTGVNMVNTARCLFNDF